MRRGHLEKFSWRNKKRKKVVTENKIGKRKKIYDELQSVHDDHVQFSFMSETSTNVARVWCYTMRRQMLGIFTHSFPHTLNLLFFFFLISFFFVENERN